MCFVLKVVVYFFGLDDCWMSVLCKYVIYCCYFSRLFGCLLILMKFIIFLGLDEYFFVILVFLVFFGFRLFKYLMRYLLLVLLFLLLLLFLLIFVFWFFKEKWFKDEVFINVGFLGLSKFGGRVVVIGDWDGDLKCVFYCWLWRLYWLCVRFDLFMFLDEVKIV